MDKPEATLIIRDSNLRAGFTQLPNEVLKDIQLSSGSKLLYALLLSYAWQENLCYPGQETLAKDSNSNTRTIQRHLDALVKRGLISVERRGLSKTNIYYIEPLGSVYPEADTTELSSPDTTEISTLDTTLVSHKEYSVEEYSFKNIQKEDIESDLKSLLIVLRKLPYWGQAEELEKDTAWLIEFLTEFPELSEQLIRECRDFWDGRRPRNKGIWKNRLRNWCRTAREIKVNPRQHSPVYKKKPGAIPTDAELEEQERRLKVGS